MLRHLCFRRPDFLRFWGSGVCCSRVFAFASGNTKRRTPMLRREMQNTQLMEPHRTYLDCCSMLVGSRIRKRDMQAYHELLVEVGS